MKNEIYAFMSGIIVGVAILFATLSLFYDHTAFYKQGQIDALSGKVAFELKKQPNGSTLWKRIEK
jgi:hypothetical protein